MNSGELLRFIKDRSGVTLLDGGMGTLLAEKGWSPPALPEEMNLHCPVRYWGYIIPTSLPALQS